jgi:integrase
MPKLTKSVVDALRPPHDGRKDRLVFDSELKGLGLRITASGSKTWLAQYSVTGQKRRLALGSVKALTPDHARRRAKEVLGLAAAGRDPFAEARAERVAQRQQDEIERNTITRIADEFLERHARPRQRTHRETERRLRVYVLPSWGSRSIASIRRKDVVMLLDRIVEDHGPIMANRVLNTVRKMFNWAAARDILEASPISGLEPPGEEKSRERVLSDTELAAVWRGLEKLGWPWANFLKILILTGQRRGEVADMRWPEVNLVTGIWSVPGERTKNGRANVVHLSKQALAVLADARQTAHAESGWVFTTTGRKPLSGFSKMKRRLDQISGVRDWNLHDLRRTMVTIMADMNIAPHVSDRILNHVDGTIRGVARIYQRNEFLPERKRALEAWGNYVERLSEAADDGKVVPLRT